MKQRLLSGALPKVLKLQVLPGFFSKKTLAEFVWCLWLITSVSATNMSEPGHMEDWDLVFSSSAIFDL